MKHSLRWITIVALAAVATACTRNTQEPGKKAELDVAQNGAILELRDAPGSHLDVVTGGRVVTRYMYALDRSSPERLHETYKPFLHVFDAEGNGPITKGPHGKYTHHRGIFIGFRKLRFGSKIYNHWSMKDVQQVHQKFTVREAGAGRAKFTSLVHWNDGAGQNLVEEERTMVVRTGLAPVPAYVLIDFTSILKAPRGEVKLGGDPEHAGVQFRPANEVQKSATVYVFPRKNANPKKDRDYPWVGETFTLGEKKYSVVHMNHPQNPRPTTYSAYRDYGRFGAFFTATIKAGGELTVKYRFLVAEGEMPPAEMIQKSWDDFAGVSTPSPVPELTVTGGIRK